LSIQHACDERSFLKQAKSSTDVRMAHGCPTLKPFGSAYGNRYHKGVSGGEKDMLNTFVTVLRPPRERFMSNFCDGLQHHHGLSEEHKENLGFKMTHNGKWDNVSAVQESLQAYVAESKITFGCYVRMLTGSMCSDADVVVDEALTQEAIANLDQFLFVGVSENYTSTVEVFLKTVASAAHAVDAGTFVVNEGVQPADYRYELSSPDRVELRVVGEGSHNVACEKIARMLLATGKVKYADKFDQQVYDHAKKLFQKFAANATAIGSTPPAAAP
jgi:hypothetical protein